MLHRWPRKLGWVGGSLVFALTAWLGAQAQIVVQPNNNGAAGVAIDADGVLRMQVTNDPGGQLMRRRLAEAKANLNADLAKPSALRKVSLNRLEAALAAGKITDEMRNLAGLTRLQYVFYFPETRDIVIAGPAEGFVPDVAGRMIGVESGRAVLQLEDLVVALRAFPPAGRAAGMIGCSIDPTAEGLANMQKFLNSIPRTNPGPVSMIVKGLKESLGHHKVSVFGVSNKTHFAQVLVEADYRMKLIGIGLEKPNVPITSYVSAATPSSVARNALQRWYFVPNYECVRVAEGNLAAEFVGEGVKLVGESELVAAGGNRENAAKVDRASQVFTTSFTKQYPELARRNGCYAQLRNLVDMAIAAAFMQKQDWYAQAGWKMDLFGNEQAFSVETLPAPATVESTINVIARGSSLMTPIGGGVKIEPRYALSDESLLTDENGAVQAAREKVDLSKLPANRWWWD